MSTDAGTSSASGSIFLRKSGPLPNWVWMGLLLLVALVYSMWKRNRAETVAVDQDQTVTEPLPGDQTPPPVFILPQNPQPSIVVNVPGTPARPGTPTPAPPAGTRPPGPKPAPPPAKPPAKPAVTYASVPVVKYTTKNPPWNSTLSGIASHYGIKDWRTIWNDPKNAALRSKRGAPDRIQPKDVIYVRR